jgi:hypothetical protein
MESKDHPATPEHPLGLLPEFVAGRLSAVESDRVRRHLDGCSDCRLELRAWQETSAAARERYGPAAVAVPERLAELVVGRVAEEAAARRSRPALPLRHRLRWLGQLVASQVPLVRREIWPASTVVMAIGAAVSLTTAGRGGAIPGTALALLAPLAAALGIATIYGEENDPALELALASPTSPRLIVLARLVLVLAWDLGLAAAASMVLAVANGPAVFVPLVSLWLGPMLLLGCLALFLSLFIHSSLAIAAASVLWIARALEVAGPTPLHDLGGFTAVLDAIWQTSPSTVTIALLLLCAAVALIPSREPLGARSGI